MGGGGDGGTDGDGRGGDGLRGAGETRLPRGAHRRLTLADRVGEFEYLEPLLRTWSTDITVLIHAFAFWKSSAL